MSWVISRPRNRISAALAVDHARHRLRGGGLAAAGLAHERHHLARGDCERHAFDRMHRLLRPTGDGSHHATRHRIPGDEPVDLQQRLALGTAHAGFSATRWSFRWHTRLVPGPKLESAWMRRWAGRERRVASRRERAANDLAIEPRRRAGDRSHVLVAEQIGCRREQHARVRMARIVVDRRHPPHLDDLAGVHHRGAVAHLRHNRKVVRDQDHRQAQVARRDAPGAPGSGPAPSRRARSSARRRAGPEDRTRARGRSPPAGASRPRTRADTDPPGPRRSPRARAARAPAPGPSSWTRCHAAPSARRSASRSSSPG